METPRTLPTRWLAGVLIAAALFWALDLAVLRAGVPDPLDDTWEYGVAARHLLAGDGFRTSVIHPPLWERRDQALTVPVLIHGPVVTLLVAPWLAALGPAALDRVAWLAAAMAVLAAALILRTGARAASPAVGAGAALLFTLSPLTVRAVNHDLSIAVGACLLALVLDLLARPRPLSLAAGLALGAAVLVRPEMLCALPAFLLLAGGGGLLPLLAGTALVAAPWWRHNQLAVGSPFFNLSSYMIVGFSPRWPELSVLRDFSLTPERWPDVLRASWPAVAEKAVELFPHALKRALQTPSPLTGWLAALGAVAGLAEPGTRRLAAVALWCAAIPIAVMTLTIFETRYLAPFLPLWALAAALAAGRGAGLLPAPRLRAPAALLLLAALVLPATLAQLGEDTRLARRLEPRLARERAALAALGPPVEATRPLYSDTPDFVAWTTGRPAVWMTRREYDRLPPGTGGTDRPGRGAGDAWFHEDPGYR